MEELIKKFSAIIETEAFGFIRIREAGSECAEETKKLAITFATFIENECKNEGDSMYCRITNNSEVEPKNFASVTKEGMFNIFIKEYYGRK